MSSKYIQIIILASVFSLQYFFEHVFPQRKEINDSRNERFNFAIGLINVLLTLIPAMAMVRWVDFIKVERIGLFNQIRLPFFMILFLSILILDVWMYAWHQLNHKIPFLWRFHIFHHKDEKMNTTTALRFHIADLLLSYPGKACIVFILGISFVPLLVYEVIFFTSVIIHHSNIFITEKTDNIYRKLFASPLMHRIHHSINLRESNSNFGAVFSFWDAIFNTRIKKSNTEIVFGAIDKKNI